MSERLSDIGGKLLAGVILVIAAWILLKIVFGFISWALTVALAIAAVIAVVWALNRIL